MPLDMYACICVKSYKDAEAWYARFFGTPPSFVASDTEAVWELAENRSVAIEERPDRAGHAVVTVFVDDFTARVDAIATRGIEPHERLTYRNGVRKAIYRDPDGNEFGLGGAPAAAP